MNSKRLTKKPNLQQDRDLEFQALSDFAELAGDWFWEQDAEYRFTRFSGVSTESLRRKQSDFIGKRRWEMSIEGVTPEQLAEHIATCERHETFRRFDYDIPADSGLRQYFSVSGKPIFNDEGQFIGYRGIGRNVTELRKAELAIQENERKLRQIVHGNPVPTFVIDADHKVIYWNQACANLTGITETELLGGTPVWQAFFQSPKSTLADLIMSGADDAMIGTHYEKFNRSGLIHDAYEVETRLDRPGKEVRWLHVTSAPIKDVGGQLVGAIETIQDVTSEVKAKAILRGLASHDGLTGIANRRHFDETLALEWKRAKRDSLTLSLLMIDIDHFKRFNDAYGHQAGDQCLQRIAEALDRTVFRPTDLVARYGGEEFSVILTSTDAEGASIVAKRILERVTGLAIPHCHGEGGRVSLSIGISSVVPQRDLAFETLISSADKALYKAKRSGRNCCMLADGDLPGS